MQSVDVPGMLQDTEELSRKTTKLQFKRYSKLKVGNMLRRHFNEDRAPRGLTFKKFLQTLQGLTDKKLGVTEWTKRLATTSCWSPECPSRMPTTMTSSA